MQTLDFAEIRERDECWWDKYDLTCPHCGGDSDHRCPTCDGEETVECLKCEGSGQIDGHDCKTCDGTGYWPCEDCDGSEAYCEHCSDGYFEVMWNTAFEVKVWDNYLDVEYNSAKWQEAYKLAWDMGFCLIEHGRKRYLLMAMCGLDCTWLIHYTRWKLQGFLDIEDCQQCIGSGGYVFLTKGKHLPLCEYIKGRLTTPEAYAKSYERDIAKLEHIIQEFDKS